jgi:hypothetical protein
LNHALGVSEITPEHVMLCTTILHDPRFEIYKNKWVVVESFSYDDAALAAQYGFKKYLTMHELCALYPTLCPVSIYDCL